MAAWSARTASASRVGVGGVLLGLLLGHHPFAEELLVAGGLVPSELLLGHVALKVGLRLPEQGGVPGQVGLRLADGLVEGPRVDEEQEVAPC